MKRIDFNQGWRYGHPGEEKAPVCLPHDAMLRDGRAPDAASGSGGAFFRSGKYEYEKEFEVPAEWAGGILRLQFEGVMRNTEVRVNGVFAGGAPYGYIPFWIDLGPLVRYGEKNVIQVCADNSAQPASRWYSGGGIYRPVWLWQGAASAISPQGLRVRTISRGEPEIEVELLAEGDLRGLSARLEICGEDAWTAADCVLPLDDGRGKCAIRLPGAKCWSAEAPNLYCCRAVLMRDGGAVDSAQVQFGVRTVEKSREGLLINGSPVKLRGGSVHHDNGVIGAASTPESEWRKVRILKENGFNALRCAHNPASEALLQAADYYGIYVIDETWDMWFNHKTQYDYASDFRTHCFEDIEEIAARDYSHPSVIMYSIGNEVSEPAGEKGMALAKAMIDRFHALDPSRLVTAGINIIILSQSAKGKGIYDEAGGGESLAGAKSIEMNSTTYNIVASIVGTGMSGLARGRRADKVSRPIFDALDVCGYNYASTRYAGDGKKYPDRLIYGSEIFPQDAAKNWAIVQKHPHLVGDFLWTALDYLGEVGVGAWAYTPDGKRYDKPYPWKLADVGALDLLGNPNAEMFWAQAAWGVSSGCKLAVRPVNHPGVTPTKATWRGSNAIPSWSWEGCEGNRAVVEVFTAGANAELYVNDRPIGRRRVKNCRAVFRTKYVPGVLRAVAFDDAGNKIGEDALGSAKGELRLNCRVVREPGNRGNFLETVYLEIEICDPDGTVESNHDVPLRVQVQNAELLGFGSANPRTEEAFTTGCYTTRYGRALAAIRKEPDAKAFVKIEGGGFRAEQAI